jgi:hypothetical protein
LTYALARKIEILPLQLAEDFQELLEEPHELGGELIIVADARLALAETSLY